MMMLPVMMTRQVVMIEEDDECCYLIMMMMVPVVMTMQVVKQCVATEGVPAAYVLEDVVPPFFQNFWTRRLAMDKRNYKQVGLRAFPE
jgi:hypothetical protein